MQEVKGFLNGDWNYKNLHGQTGPLVYPSLFVYIYSILYKLTNEDILYGQYLFLIFYLILLFILLIIYSKYSNFKNENKIYLIILMLIISKRIHSIFILRMFNDCISMIFLYLSIFSICLNKFNFSLFFYSCALGIKMNILLFFPAIGILLTLKFGLFLALIKIFLFILLPQIIFSLPFLYENYLNYLNLAFDFKREFNFKWTVNFRFLGEELFKSKLLAKYLLILHFLFLLIFIFTKYLKLNLFIPLLFKNFNLKNKKLNPHYILYIMFTSNFIGICFSRSLHYQFYIWYFHSLPFLLFEIPFIKLFKNNSLNNLINYLFRFIILLSIEYVWNVYPSTFYSSIILHICHFIILIGLLIKPAPPITLDE
ncbi:hypothetical protein ABK040_012085 [Willaertia magna]